MDPHCSRIKDLPNDATHYQVLDIKPSETTKTSVTRKYRLLSLKCHPDKNDKNEEDEYTEIMKRIVDAKEFLLPQAPDTVGVDLESCRISSILNELKINEDIIHLNPDITYDEVINLFHHIDTKLFVRWDRTNSEILESYYGIVNAVIYYWLQRKNQLTDYEKMWIIGKINGLFGHLSRLIPYHKKIFKEDDTYKIFEPILLRPQYKRLLENIGYARESRCQGGSRRKSTNKRRNLRNKCRTRRHRHRKYRKSK